MNNDKYKLVKHINTIHHNLIASEILDLKKEKYRFDSKIMDNGINWAKSGFTLEDA